MLRAMTDAILISYSINCTLQIARQHRSCWIFRVGFCFLRSITDSIVPVRAT
jgi:hypothetical protein